MNSTLIASWYEYGVAMNEHLLTTAAQLTDEQWRRTTSKGYQSLHRTFTHMLNAEGSWFYGWQQKPFLTRYTPEQLPTPDAIRQAWAPLITERRAHLAAIADEYLVEPLPRRDSPSETFIRWWGMAQCANHATQHRAEIAAMLTDAGHSPGDIDLLDYVAAHVQPQAVGTQAVLASLFEYAYQAVLVLLDKAAILSDAQWQQVFSQGYGSIHATFAHLVSAERRWLARWQEQTPPERLTVADLPTPASMRALWETVCVERRAYMASLDESACQADAHFNLNGQPELGLPRWQAMLHVANHGMQHRSEIAAMLTDCEQSPGDLDYLFYW